MKNLATAILGTSLALAVPAFADDAHHPEKEAKKPAAAAPAKKSDAMGDKACPMHKEGGMGMMGKGMGAEHEAMMNRMQQLEKRMDMMQMMLEQMMKSGTVPAK